MNRVDFMKNLSELLADVPLSEREEAIQYYNDYFDDAGEENEQSVIASLGTPEQLAGTIKAGLADGGNIGEFTEKGFSGYEQKTENEVLDLNSAEAKSGSGGSSSYDSRNHSGSQYYNSNQTAYGNQGGNGNQSAYGNQGYNGSQNSYNSQGNTETKPYKKQKSGGTTALIVILCILASPFLIGIGGGLLGVVVGIIGALFGIIVGFGAAAIALIAVGVWLLIHGIVMMFGTPLAGLFMIGAAMICVALGLVFLWLTVIICGALIPAICKGIAKLFNNIFHKGGAEA